MPCQKFQVDIDGSLNCLDSLPPRKIGHIKQPPEDLSEGQYDAINFFHRIVAFLNRMDRIGFVRPNTGITSGAKEPIALLSVFFAVPFADKKSEEKLNNELRLFTTDLNDAGCPFNLYKSIQKTLRRGEQDWKPSAHVWQLYTAFPEREWGSETNYACMKMLIDSITKTRLSEFIDPMVM